MSFKTNIVALSDVHLRSSTPIGRKDNFLKTQFKKLRYVFEYAQRHNAVILQAGDFVHQSRDWSILTRLIKFFQEFPDVDFYCVLGQHDSYYHSRSKSTTIGILEDIGYVKVLSAKPTTIHNAHIYGSSWGKGIPFPETAYPPDCNILVIHRSLSPTQIFPGQKYEYPATFLEENPRYKLIINGDIHQAFFHKRKADGRIIVNTGPMLRAEATEYNMERHSPHFYHFKVGGTSMEYNVVNIPHEEAEHVLSRHHIPQSQHEHEEVINELAELIENANMTSDDNLTKTFKNIFSDGAIRARVRFLMKEIYADVR